MLKEVRKEFKKANITFNQKVLIAVSGGVDSMVLWDLVYKSKKLHGVAHVNFSLRGEESDLDERLVESIAKERNIPFHSIKVDTEAYAAEKKMSIQMAARKIRYDFFSQLQKEKNYDIIATAHHLEDNIETLLINLNRGTGIKGLTGIHSTTDKLRPLLSFSKNEIIEYAKEQEVAYRNDTTNVNTRYDRNWFRHEIIAKWRERNPKLLQVMKSNLEHLNDAYELVELFLKMKQKE